MVAFLFLDGSKRCAHRPEGRTVGAAEQHAWPSVSKSTVPTHRSETKGPPVSKSTVPTHRSGVKGPPVSRSTIPTHRSGAKGPSVSRTTVPTHRSGARGPPVSKSTVPTHRCETKGPSVSKSTVRTHRGGARRPFVSKSTAPTHRSGAKGLPVLFTFGRGPRRKVPWAACAEKVWRLQSRPYPPQVPTVHPAHRCRAPKRAHGYACTCGKDGPCPEHDE